MHPAILRLTSTALAVSAILALSANGAQAAPAPALPMAASAPGQALGKSVFERTCASCHLADGSAVAGAFPLANSDSLQQQSHEMAHIVLHGRGGAPVVKGEGAHDNALPPQDLDDHEVAALINYLNVEMDGKPVLTAAQVKQIRKVKAN